MSADESYIEFEDAYQECAEACHLTQDQCAHIAGGLADIWAGLRLLPERLESPRDPPSIDRATYLRLFSIW